MAVLSKPDTRYASSGEFRIAYQVLGDGPLDLVVAPGFVSHLDLQWTDPDWARGIRRLASFSRLILFDKRGTGLSDPVSSVPTLEERMDDVLAVMDAAGTEQAALFGFSEGAAIGLLLAATYPERVSALALFGSLVTGTPAPGTVSWAAACAEAYDGLAEVVEHWGEGRLLGFMAPSVRQGELGRRLTGVFERTAASPAMARAMVEAMRRLDLGDILASIEQPTLIMHRAGEVWPVEAARDLANRIPKARYVELGGTDHWWWAGDAEAVLGETEEFLTGARRNAAGERTLATVLFTDIVSSTEIAAKVGDQSWRGLLERHDALVQDQLNRFRGRAIKSTGDGFLATFDGPARGIECARAIVEGAEELGIQIRAGLHTGECETMADDIGGMAVHIGARVSAAAAPGEILVSGTVKDLVVGSRLRFTDRGTHELKGVPGSWWLFALDVDEDHMHHTSANLAPPARTPLVARTLAGFAKHQPRLATRLVGLSRWSRSETSDA